MKLSTSSLLLALSFATATPVENLEKRSTVKGFDISHYQGTVDFRAAYNSGARFVIIKVSQTPLCNLPPFPQPPVQNPQLNPTPPQATEGTTYIDPGFSSHYTGATSAGLIRGGYHFAHPNSGSGATQANYL